MNKTFRVNYIDWIAMALVVIGALNWGLVGLAGLFTGGANWNLVSIIFGGVPVVENLIYLVVALSGLYVIYFAYRLSTVDEIVETTEHEPASRTA